MRWLLSIVVCWTAATMEARAVVKVPAVLGEGMVLQREMPVPIWGTADLGEKVTVTFRGQTKTAVADDRGKWAVKLDPLKPGGPDALTIVGSNTLRWSDILVGDVWLGGGQSNMGGPVAQYADRDPVVVAMSKETYPKIRIFSQGWHVAAPEKTWRFSALLFSFAVRLQPEIDVPIGLMVGAAGGTPSVSFMSKAAFDADPVLSKAKVIEEGKHSAKVGAHYEQKFRPLVPFAIRGVLWDQGEAGTAVEGVNQDIVMNALIRGWRKDWGQGDFPFIAIQKPSGGGTAWSLDNPVTNRAESFLPLPKNIPPVGDDRFPAFLKLASIPGVSLVHSSDLGGGVHPGNKSGYGTRAARVALGAVYGKPIVYQGPTHRAHSIDGAKVRIAFDHVGKGLAVRHADAIQGFAIAGDDKVFHWADAEIVGEEIVASSPNVKAPVAVRYAWSWSRRWANLFNRDEYPAVPFRTDDWKD